MTLIASAITALVGLYNWKIALAESKRLENANNDAHLWPEVLPIISGLLVAIVWIMVMEAGQ